MTRAISQPGEGYSIRSYQPGDEQRLAELFNKQYGQYAGVVLRDVAYWRWCCLMRPDVEPNGVILVTKGQTILAYAVVNRIGIVFELSYEEGAESEPILFRLLGGITSYLWGVAAEGITLHVPSNDHVLRKVLDRFGFIEAPWKVLANVTCVDFHAFFRQILHQSSVTPPLRDGFLIHLTGPPPPENVVVCIEKGQVVEGDASRKPSVVIRTSKQVMLSVIFGGASASLMLLNRSLHVKPLRKINKALKLLSALRLKAPWYDPLTDLA